MTLITMVYIYFRETVRLLQNQKSCSDKASNTPNEKQINWNQTCQQDSEKNTKLHLSPLLTCHDYNAWEKIPNIPQTFLRQYNKCEQKTFSVTNNMQNNNLDKALFPQILSLKQCSFLQ